MKISPRLRLIQVLKVLRVLCQSFGTAPVLGQFGQFSFKRFWHNFWCLIILLYIYMVSLFQAMRIDAKRPTIEKMFYLLEFVTNCIIITALIVNIWNGNFAEQYRVLPKKLVQLELLTSRYERRENIYGRLFKELCLYCALTGFFLLSCLTIDIIFLDFDILKFFQSAGAYILPNILITLCLAQYWIVLRFVCMILRRLNDELASLSQRLQAHELNWYRREFPGTDIRMGRVTAEEEKTWKTKPFSVINFINHIRGLYPELDDLNSKLNGLFGFAIIFIIFSAFIKLNIEYFAMYQYYDNTNSMTSTMFVYKIFWLVLHNVRLYFVLQINDAITKEKSRRYFLLNELTITSDVIVDKTCARQAINRIYMQLLSSDSTESACGVIELDLLFFGSFYSALAMYLIFLIQTDLGNIPIGNSTTTNPT